MSISDTVVSWTGEPEKRAPQSGAPARAASPAPPLPPEWPLERWIKRVGKIPAAAGKMLDRLAKAPLIGPPVRLFSSVVFGLIILGLIALYIAIGSGFADFRAKMEMTDLQFFDAWPMRVLLMLLVLDLSIVTLRRIPLTLFKLGSWTVHVGIITLITGSVLYFGLKQEGSARIYLNQTVDSCYDTVERALYAFPMNDKGAFDTEHAVMIPVPGMPYFGERLLENGNPLEITLGNAGLGAMDPALKDVRLTVVGYYPDARMVELDQREGQPGEKGEGPAVEWTLDSDRGRFGSAEWLLANSPAGRVVEAQTLPFALEYLYHPTAARLREISTAFDGEAGLTVRIARLGIEKTFVANQGAAIAVEGSPYTLTPLSMDVIPMISKGYEGASSTTMTVKVSHKNPDGTVFDFERQLLFRYPERSPDWVMENGQRKRKQDGVDADIELVFHDATRPQFWLVESEDGKLQLVRRMLDPKGDAKVTVTPIGADGTAPLEVDGFAPMKLRLLRHFANAVPVLGPMAVPVAQRKLSQTAADIIQTSIAMVKVEQGGAVLKERAPVEFSQFAQVTRWGDDRDPGREPAVIEVPVKQADGTAHIVKFGLLMSTVKRPLPVEVTLTDFHADKYPGAASTYMDYTSALRFKDKATGQVTDQLIHLNNPGRDHGMTYFQAFWDGDDHAPAERRFSIVGIGNRPGVWGMIAGAALIVTGIGYAFYVKPILLKKKKADLAAWAAAR